MYPIITSTNLEDLEFDLAIINVIATNYWSAQDFDFDANGDLIPKLMSTGESNPSAVRTETWDVIKETDGVYWIHSPAKNPDYALYRQRFEGWKCQESMMPLEWATRPEPEDQ